MADEPNTPVTDPSPPPEGDNATLESQATASPSRRRATWLAVPVLVALGLVVGLESAGLLLRDRLENRQLPLAEAPVLIGEPDSEPGRGPVTGARFGPGVREVTVTGSREPPPRPPTAATPPAAPTEKPETPNEPPVAAAPEPQPAAPPSPTPPTPEVAEPAQPPGPVTAQTPPPPAVTHALQVGLFSSQKYRHDMEQQLETAGFPHFRAEKQKNGVGYRLAVPLAGEPDRKRARAAMDAAGYLYQVSGNSLEAIFHFEEEAQRALRELAKAGLKGGYGRIEGEVPLWVVYAGPYDDVDQAKQVRQQLAIQGLPSYLRTLP